MMTLHDALNQDLKLSFVWQFFMTLPVKKLREDHQQELAFDEHFWEKWGAFSIIPSTNWSAEAENKV